MSGKLSGFPGICRVCDPKVYDFIISLRYTFNLIDESLLDEVYRKYIKIELVSKNMCRWCRHE
jgi:hypothetical protein